MKVRRYNFRTHTTNKTLLLQITLANFHLLLLLLHFFFYIINIVFLTVLKFETQSFVVFIFNQFFMTIIYLIFFFFVSLNLK